ncbi:AMP-binding protein, partial [Fangia hongkongensis]|uniref:AMP-binding protein n=1 Tax=Fangia hongkongensis TaxID=270495 RepID=UPI001F368672
MISNGAYSFFIKNFLGMLELPKQEPISMLSLTNYVFDIFGLEYAMPLISGGRVILSSLSLVTETEISKSNLVQQTPRVLLALCERYGDFLKNKTCIVGGELSNGKIVETLLHCFKEVFNVYGPTETTVWSTIHQFENKDQYAIIGRPLSNEKVYLLDSSLSPVKIGEIGELYIGGVGLARGYLNL